MQDLTSSKQPTPAVMFSAMLLALAAWAVLPGPGRDEAATALPQASPSSAAPSPAELSPTDQVDLLLEKQSAALLAGDEKGWLAPVDRKLQAKYKTLYRNMRQLDVTTAEQRMDELPDVEGDSLTVRVKLGYCFSGTDCGWKDAVDAGPPKLAYKLTWTRRAGSWAITAMAAAGIVNYLQPTPWESSPLVFAKGKRVTVAAPAAQAKNVKRILPLAEKAAVVADRYAGYADNPQKRYRVYIADDKAWKTWYSGAAPGYAVAYHLSLNNTGGDIVLRGSKVLDGGNDEVTEIIQHEFAHAVTLIASANSDEDDDLWLIEGVAEYIGFMPRKPQNSYSRDVLRYVFDRRGAIKTIALKPLTDKSDDITVANFYASGHFAAGCMAAKFGERKMLDFVDRVLQFGQETDDASRAVYGKPFKAVDKECVTWIKNQV